MPADPQYDYDKYTDPDHPHRCNDCTKQLSRADAFRRHVRTAHYKVAEKLRSYHCRDCDYASHTPTLITGHYGNVHSPSAEKPARCVCERAWGRTLTTLRKSHGRMCPERKVGENAQASLTGREWSYDQKRFLYDANFDDTLVVPRREGERLPRKQVNHHEEIGEIARESNYSTHGHNLHVLSRDLEEMNEQDPDFDNFGQLSSSPDQSSPSLAKPDLTPRKSVIYGCSPCL